jgi:metal-dependent amidase/aminoacylase/carboxypeptidase family protein
MDALKQRIAESVDGLGDELDALSTRIHAHPELAFEERRACGWIGEFLAKHGFQVETGVGGVAILCASTTRCPASATPAGTTSSPRRGPARAP